MVVFQFPNFNEKLKNSYESATQKYKTRLFHRLCTKLIFEKKKIECYKVEI